jgi:hypothetical protein
MAVKVTKRPIRRKAAVHPRKIETPPSAAAAISAAYELAERFVENQRDLLHRLIETVTEQFGQHAPKGRVVTKASARKIAHKPVVKSRATRRAA